ncbi:MAG: HIT domain-containing protein, partial [Myxococcaceae bacterium]|nr:HIT domain-containing protein [Myxococcaceae bacterium]
HAVDDARLPVTRAEAWAQAFGSERVELPEGGCLDAAAGLGTWPAGFERLRQLRARAPFRPSPRLETDSELIAQGPLSQLRLMDEARYPWALLVPRVSAAEDARHLTANQRLQLEAETHAVSDALARAFGVDKVNVASLGNVVRQLHVHVVGRSLGDAAWPGPVWGHSPRVSASPALAAQRRGRLLEALGESGGFTAVAPAAGRAEGRRQR